MGIKYYHSAPMQVRKLYCLTTAEGTPIYYHDSNTEFVKNLPRVTVCSILDGSKLSFGYTTCSSKDDYRKKLGRKVAYERACKKPYKVVEIPNMNEIHNISAKIVDEIFDLETKRIYRIK